MEERAQRAWKEVLIVVLGDKEKELECDKLRISVALGDNLR